jgi:hypothetical protein
LNPGVLIGYPYLLVVLVIHVIVYSAVKPVSVAYKAKERGALVTWTYTDGFL